MSFVKREGTGRKNHGDIILKVESFGADGQSVTGVNMQTGEELEVSLASTDEIAKYFSTRNDNRTFDERLKSAENRIKRRPDINVKGSLEEGSVLRLENVRSYPTDGAIKNVAMWPIPVVRDPKQEAAVFATVDVRFKEDKTSKEMRPFVVMFDEAASVPLDKVNFADLFNGDFQGIPVSTSGAQIIARAPDGEIATASLTTPFRDQGEQTLAAALDGKPFTQYELLAAAVIVAKSGGDFGELNISERTFEDDIENARRVFDDIKNDGGVFEVMVVPIGTASFLPTHAEPDFLKEYYGTTDGKPAQGVQPDVAVSYQNKGLTPSFVAISRNKHDPENGQASLTEIRPINGYQFREQPERNTVVAMEELMAERLGASNGGSDPNQQKERNLAPDPSPMG